MSHYNRPGVKIVTALHDGEAGVDGLGDGPGGFVIRLAQQEPDLAVAKDFAAGFAFDVGPAGDAAYGGVIFLGGRTAGGASAPLATATRPKAVSADQDRALRHGVINLVGLRL